MAIFLESDDRKHKVNTETILSQNGQVLFRVSSVYRVEPNGSGTMLIPLVPGLGQLVNEDETTLWQNAILHINDWYKQQRTRDIEL